MPSSPPVRWTFDGPVGQSTTPASPSIAVGTTHTVYVTKDQITWRTVANPTNGQATGIFTNTPLGTFFSSPANAVFASPRVVYDQFANRFVLGVIENVNVSGTTTSRLLIAVSDNSNPADGTWFKQARQNVVDIGGNTYSSQMGLAVDEEAVYVTTSQNRFSDDVYVDARVRIIDKGISTSGWYGGGTPVFSQLLDPDPSATNQSRYFGLAPVTRTHLWHAARRHNRHLSGRIQRRTERRWLERIRSSRSYQQSTQRDSKLHLVDGRRDRHR